jgi:hypothetical protein
MNERYIYVSVLRLYMNVQQIIIGFIIAHVMFYASVIYDIVFEDLYPLEFIPYKIFFLKFVLVRTYSI